MKRVFTLVFTVVMAVFVLAGCGSKDSPEVIDTTNGTSNLSLQALENKDLSQVMNTINSAYSLSLKTLESVGDLKKYYSINPDDVKQFAAEIDSNNNAPVEIVLVEATDSKAADSVEKALTQRYNSIVSQYTSYTPEKLDMVKACKVTKDGNYVSLIVAENGPEMLQTFRDGIK